MKILAAFLSHALFSLVVGLAAAAFLGPEHFGRFALGLAAAGFVQILAFDWLRLSATRFYSQSVREQRPQMRAVLNAGFAWAAGVIAGVGALAIALLDRLWVAHRWGYAQSGYFSLAFDIGWRVLAAFGAALDVLLFQIAVRANEKQGATHACLQCWRLPHWGCGWLRPACKAYLRQLLFMGLFLTSSCCFCRAFSALRWPALARRPGSRSRRKPRRCLWPLSSPLR